MRESFGRMHIIISDSVRPTEGLIEEICDEYGWRHDEFAQMSDANLSRNAVRAKKTDSIHIKVSHRRNGPGRVVTDLEVLGWKWETDKKETMLSIHSSPGIVVLDSFRQDLIMAYDAKIKTYPHLEYCPCTVRIDHHVEKRAGSYVILRIDNYSHYLKVDGWYDLPDWLSQPHDFCPKCDTCRCDNCLRLRPMQCRCDTAKSTVGDQQ